MATLPAVSARSTTTPRYRGLSSRASSSIRGSYHDHAAGRRTTIAVARNNRRRRHASVGGVVVTRASICGIDLGTTNSAVAVIIDGKAVVVADEKGHRTIPSIVTFLPKEGEVLVGHDARKRLTKDPSNTYHSVKRFIGRRFKDKRVGEDARRVPFEIVASTPVSATASSSSSSSSSASASASALSLAGLGPKGDGAGRVRYHITHTSRTHRVFKTAFQPLQLLLSVLHSFVTASNCSALANATTR